MDVSAPVLDDGALSGGLTRKKTDLPRGEAGLLGGHHIAAWEAVIPLSAQTVMRYITSLLPHWLCSPPAPRYQCAAYAGGGVVRRARRRVPTTREGAKG